MGRWTLTRTRGTPGLLAAAGAFVGLTVLYVSAGTFSTTDRPGWGWAARELIGMSLMLIGVTTYLTAAWTITQRRSAELVEELRPQLTDPADADTALDTIASAWGRTWWLGTLLGLGLSLFNTNPLWATQAPYPFIALSISLGQIFLWTVIGNVLCVRVIAANVFAHLGEKLPVDVLRLGRLRPLARNGVLDAAIVMGALLFAPLQSLDFEFRPGNYRFALLVATPSLAFYLIWPLRLVHRRIRADRDARLARVEEQLDAIGDRAAESSEGTVRLEQLLAHRDRLADARTWPLDLRLLTRVLVYVIIPPIAWALAALVERAIDTLLGGG